MEPVLATSWRVGDDRLTWTIELREGVTFSDGTPFNAGAVKANLDRWLSPELEGLARRFASLAGLIRSVDEVSVLGEHILSIKTKAPQPFVPDFLSGGGTQIVSPALLERVGIDSEMLGDMTIGTGPFVVESFVAGEGLTLVRNEDYWGEKAWLDRIIFQHIGDATARTAALVTGQVDLALVVDETQAPILRNDPGIVIVAQPAQGQTWIQMNLQKPPLDRVEVRQALNYAVDMETINDIAYEGFLAAFQGAMNPAIFRPDPAIGGFSYDPAKARELLARVGVSNLELTLTYEDAHLTTRHAEMLQAQLREVGVTLQLQRMDTPAHVELRDAGRHDLASQGHGNSAYVPVLSYTTTLRSDSGAPYARVNGYANLKIDDLIARALVEVDRQRQVQLLNEIHREFIADPPWLAPFTRTLIYAHSSRVMGFTSHPDQAVAYERIWLRSGSDR